LLNLCRQRKLKEAREVAEQEIAKYRREKEQEFEKIKAEVTFLLSRKLIKNSRLTFRRKLKNKLPKFKKITIAIKRKLLRCLYKRFWKLILASLTLSKKNSSRRNDQIPIIYLHIMY
jgi:hypothetical protein